MAYLVVQADRELAVQQSHRRLPDLVTNNIYRPVRAELVAQNVAKATVALEKVGQLFRATSSVHFPIEVAPSAFTEMNSETNNRKQVKNKTFLGDKNFLMIKKQCILFVSQLGTRKHLM